MIERIGLSNIQSGLVALRNTAHNIANASNKDAKALETTYKETPYGVRAFTYKISEHPSLIGDMPNLLQNTTYTKMGIKLIKTADELMGYILDMKA
jgi:hypothetical protein